MKTSNSDSKLKISLKKYDKFFTEKNWKQPMYMDQKNIEVQDMEKEILKSYSSLSIQPRAKLSYSLHDKVGAVLSDSRKMGMIQKVSSVATKKSLAKISLVSSLPPIKTEVQQMQEHLRKVKNELNEVTLKTIKFSKQVSNMQASTIQLVEKSRVIEEVLSKTGEKQEGQIRQKNIITDTLKYNYQVRKNMYENLKSDIRAHAKGKHQLEQKLKSLRVQLQTLNTQLNNCTGNLNSNIYTKRGYERNQDLESEEIMIKSDVAQAKLTHQWKAEKVKKHLQQIQDYNEDIYHYETNLNAHNQLLKQLRSQQVLARIMTTLHHKHQAQWSNNEKAYALMKMHSNQNQYPEHFKDLKNSSTLKGNESMLRSSVSSKQVDTIEFDLVSAYSSTLITKQQLNQKIIQKQKLIKSLEEKKMKLFQKYIGVTLEDKITEGKKPEKKKINYDKQVKKLMEREQKVERNRFVEIEIDAWILRQQQKLKFQTSKKMSPGEKINAIVKYIQTQLKGFKPISKVEAQKKSQVSDPKDKSSKKR